MSIIETIEHKLHPGAEVEKPAATTINVNPEPLIPAAPPAAKEAGEVVEPHQSFVQTVEADGAKVIAVIELVAKDAEKGLAVASKYLPQAAALAAVFFPAEQAALTGVVNSVALIQQAVVLIKQKSALLPSGLSNAAMAEEELQLAGPIVTQLLIAEKIPVSAAFLENLINGVVAILKVRTAAA